MVKGKNTELTSENSGQEPNSSQINTNYTQSVHKTIQGTKRNPNSTKWYTQSPKWCSSKNCTQHPNTHYSLLTPKTQRCKLRHQTGPRGTKRNPECTYKYIQTLWHPQSPNRNPTRGNPLYQLTKTGRDRTVPYTERGLPRFKLDKRLAANPVNAKR